VTHSPRFASADDVLDGLRAVGYLAGHRIASVAYLADRLGKPAPVEINEAFAAQVIPSARHLGIGWDMLNAHGGTIVLGHPFGKTGARIMTTLLNGLEDGDKTVGLESMCVGGQGMAMIVERLG
jgi:hypothetical protein